jgi:hypothetical protein
MQSISSGKRYVPILLFLLLFTLAFLGCGPEPPPAPPPVDRQSPKISSIEHSPPNPGTDTQLEILVEAHDRPSDAPSGLARITVAIKRDPESDSIFSTIAKESFPVSGESAKCTFQGGPYGHGEIYYEAVACDQARNCSDPVVRPLTIQDREPPAVTVSITPTNPTNFDEITITAAASDNSKVDSIAIWADRYSGAVKHCNTFVFPKSGTCQHTARYDAGLMEYWGTATDKDGNTGTSERQSIQVEDSGYVELVGDVELLPISSAGGTVTSRGEVVTDVLEVGERVNGSDRVELRGFLTYDISDLPKGAQILEADLALLPADLNSVGTPIVALGQLEFYQFPYGTLDGRDFDGEPAQPVAKWLLLTASDLEETLAAHLASGEAQLQLRLQFEKPTGGDAQSHFMAFRPEHCPKMTVSYRCIAKRSDASSASPSCFDYIPP